MNENSVSDIFNVLEKIRKREFPEIPAVVVREVLDAQFAHRDNRAAARAKTQEIVNKFLQSVK